MVDICSPDYDPAAVVETHIEEIRRDLVANVGAAWSQEKEHLLFTQVYRFMEFLERYCLTQDEDIERQAQRPMTLENRRAMATRRQNLRRLRLAATARKQQIYRNPPPDGQACPVITAPRLVVVKARGKKKERNAEGDT